VDALAAVAGTCGLDRSARHAALGRFQAHSQRQRHLYLALREQLGLAYWHNPGFRHDFAHNIGAILLEYLTLVCWSWTGGFLLGCASRGIIQVNRALFGLMLSFGALLGAPLYLEHYWQYLHRVFSRLPPDPNSAVFAVGFYRLMLPLIVQAVLVLVPALWAMRYGSGVAKLRPLLRTGLLAAAIATLAAIVLQNPILFLFQSPYRSPRFWQTLFWQNLTEPREGLGVLVWLFHAVVYWPVVYVVANAIGRRLHKQDCGRLTVGSPGWER
jgi:hypothetical protein